MGEESPDHLYLKWCLLTAAREASAVAGAEVPGPVGVWRADVLASDAGGQWRIALEAQLAAITADDIRGRSERMLEDGVPSVWFCYRRAPWLGVVLSVRVGEVHDVVMVVEGLARFTADEWVKAGPMTLAEFLRRVFNGQMVSYSRERRAAGLALDVLWVDSRCLRAAAVYRESEESARAREETEQRRAQEAAKVLGGTTASTLRAYISRGNSEVPQPQATVGGRDQWARAVADDWVEARRRSREGVRTVMSAGDRDELSRGAAEVRDHFAADFHGTLWERPDVRKRWVLRARNEGSVREVSDALTWTVAVSLDRILPTEFLGSTVVDAVLHSFADAVEMDCNKESREGSGPGEEKVWMLYVSRSVAAMLDWFIRHHPESAHHYIGEIMRAAHRQWEIPAEETVRTLCTAVSMDGKMSDEDRKTFFALLAPPAKTA